jgi:hypothetical protein
VEALAGLRRSVGQVRLTLDGPWEGRDGRGKRPGALRQSEAALLRLKVTVTLIRRLVGTPSTSVGA